MKASYDKKTDKVSVSFENFTRLDIHRTNPNHSHIIFETSAKQARIMARMLLALLGPGEGGKIDNQEALTTGKLLDDVIKVACLYCGKHLKDEKSKCLCREENH